MENVDKKVKKTAETFFDKMGFEATTDLSKEGDVFVAKITASDGAMLIGKDGKNLLALQHLLKNILRKKLAFEGPVFVDVNKYREKSEEYLKGLAQALADKAASERVKISMRPMSAYERRVVHVELAQRSDVSTASQGEGEERRVIIEPRDS